MSLDLKIRKEYCPRLIEMGKLTNHYRDCIVAPKPKVKGGPLEEDELPSITSDCIFKAMFAQESTKEFADLLASAIIDMSYEQLTEESYLANTEVTNEMATKITRMDLVLKVGNTFINIEMNNKAKTNRNNDYAYSLHRSEANYLRKIFEKDFNPVVQVNLNNYKTEGIDKPIVTYPTYYRDIQRTKVTLIDVYLPLVMKYCDEVGIENVTELYQYIRVMFETNKSKAIELAKKASHKDVLLRYIKKLESLKGEQETMKRYCEEDDIFEAGCERGLEKGREEGREETIIEMVINMLRKGLDPKLIQEYTNLSLKKIKNIQMNL